VLGLAVAVGVAFGIGGRGAAEDLITEWRRQLPQAVPAAPALPAEPVPPPPAAAPDAVPGRVDDPRRQERPHRGPSVGRQVGSP
jgi:hypothetical protein